MKRFGIIILLAFGFSGVGCETMSSTTTTTSAQPGNQEAKRAAAMQRENQEARVAEADRNLWNSQRDLLTRDGNSAIQFY